MSSGGSQRASAADATPYLNVTSAVKQCGKTRLLEVLEPIVPSPWLTGRVSAAVLTRKVDGETPTLLLDESDAAFKHQSEYAEALRSLLNSGYRRSGISSLCVGHGADLGYRDFSTFCPKALAGIGALPDTVSDRSIRIALKRRAPHEQVDRFRQRDAPKVGAPLRAALGEWSRSAVDALQDAAPELPPSLGDRTGTSSPRTSTSSRPGPRPRWPGVGSWALAATPMVETAAASRSWPASPRSRWTSRPEPTA